MRDVSRQHAFYVSFISGLHTIDTRKPLWGELAKLSISAPWLLLGDFNTVLYAHDRLNGAPVSLYESQDFEGFLSTVGVSELPSTGGYYSWSNKGSGSSIIFSRIDRCLGNTDWFLLYDSVKSRYLVPDVSDHSPVVVEVGPQGSGGGRPFRFLNLLADHEDFPSVVQECWGSTAAGSAMLQVWSRLKATKGGLKKLHVNHFANIEQEVQLGDSNSQFFFAAMKQRHSRNRMSAICSEDGVEHVYPEEIKQEVVQFYKALLGTAADSLTKLDLPTVRAGPKLSAQARNK